ncbi:N-acetyl-gamma-glutamyl-phosphate reductase [Paraconexibacter antarcticus]|uniref:N-acetyl-gamma-glutamyl-phosphate reductase n=1 Tax=Paraconexibacter antarcticus TaxID=2949664 RepID=A0ABY5DNB7_9ACTN|nr:N-acetyl-gamma-glutamyl-phosphate reductase [Paraconexibacter antarcticus]UTI62297.1 N-acetyl-gamma-glutamyl-phosphate reductase [Paraconexibacter antarcticus]
MAEPALSRVLVAGASGYAGALAAVLVDGHPYLELSGVTSRSYTGQRLDELFPHHRVPMVLEELDLDRHTEGVDAAIVAYPHGAAAQTVAALRERGLKVVDLSADFRLRDRATYEEWYVDHTAPELLDGAVYGLPERYRAELRGAELVANPGCFPTAAILALAPLAGHLADVVIDAKTGVSGAGRGATDKTHFVSVTENVTPYGVGRHRHMPEIDQELAAAGATGLVATFTPHLLPLDQGELLSCYATLREPMDVHGAFEAAYAHEPFVELVDRPPGVRDVRGTNLCRLHVHVDPRTHKVFVFAAIDNLWKGTSSQAIQNLNLMLGYEETTGIS